MKSLSTICFVLLIASGLASAASFCSSSVLLPVSSTVPSTGPHEPRCDINPAGTQAVCAWVGTDAGGTWRIFKTVYDVATKTFSNENSNFATIHPSNHGVVPDVHVRFLTTGRYLVTFGLWYEDNRWYDGQVIVFNSDHTVFSAQRGLQTINNEKNQFRMEVTRLPGGKFAVIFNSLHTDTEKQYISVYNENGSIFGTEGYLIPGSDNIYSAIDSDGWRLYAAYDTSSTTTIMLRQFDVNPTTGAITVASTAVDVAPQTGDQRRPTISVDPTLSIGVVAVWDLESALDGSGRGVAAQMFNMTDNTIIGGNIVLPFYTAGDQKLPRVRARNGRFAFSWANETHMSLRTFAANETDLTPIDDVEIMVAVPGATRTSDPLWLSDDSILYPFPASTSTVPGSSGNGQGYAWVGESCTFATPIPTVEPPTPAPPGGTCTCPNQLGIDDTRDRIPDASKDAYTTIVLNENTWEVEFTVHDVKHLRTGHVIASKLNTRAEAQAAFTPFVSAWDANELWNPNNCTLGPLDTPNPTLGIEATRHNDCTRSYRMIFSLVDNAKQNDHCTLQEVADELNVNCSLILSSVRAYSLTEPEAFLTSETSFSAAITLPRNLNNEVADLLYATLAKCNVLNEPDFVVDCRIPGLWTFETSFPVSQSINWIDASTCVQSQTVVATFLRCSLLSVPVGTYTEASANITATVFNSSEQLTFSVEYTLPRGASATASASLQNFIISIGMLDEKYYYAGADRATMYIHVFDTSRLQITQLELFNANSQSYALRDYPQFQLSETSNSTHFIIEFRPSAIRQDSAFYRNGPHGVNISFIFTAAGGRRMATQDDGFVTFEGIRIRALEPQSPNGAEEGPADVSALGSTTVVAVAAAFAVAIAVIGSIVAIVVVRRRRISQGKHAEEVDASQV